MMIVHCLIRVILLLRAIHSSQSFIIINGRRRSPTTTTRNNNSVVLDLKKKNSNNDDVRITTTTTIKTEKEDNTTTNIRIFDNVLSSETCATLHDLAMDHASRCDSSIFDRFSKTSTTTTPLEECLHLLLNELGDTTTPHIEYWSRDEYMNIDAHCDIDERELENDGATLRYPTWSHILYLDINRIGPTCLFPNRRKGWTTTTTSDHSSSSDEVVLTVVPAVNGRLLRFKGDMMHAVPKPPHRWLLTDEEREIVDEEEYLEFMGENDDDDDDDSEVERSVILFNTWGERPPLDVYPDTNGDYIPDGIEIVDDDGDNNNCSDDGYYIPDGIDIVDDDEDSNNCSDDGYYIPDGIEIVDDDDNYDSDNDDTTSDSSSILQDDTNTNNHKKKEVQCNPRDSWIRIVPTTTSPTTTDTTKDEEEKSSITVTLMGKRRRTLFSGGKYVDLVGGSHAKTKLTSAVTQTTDVHSFCVSEE